MKKQYDEFRKVCTQCFNKLKSLHNVSLLCSVHEVEEIESTIVILYDKMACENL